MSYDSSYPIRIIDADSIPSNLQYHLTRSRSVYRSMTVFLGSQVGVLAILTEETSGLTARVDDQSSTGRKKRSRSGYTFQTCKTPVPGVGEGCLPCQD